MCSVRQQEWEELGSVLWAGVGPTAGVGCGFSLVVHLAELFDQSLQLRVPPQAPNEPVRLHLQIPQRVPGVGEGADLLQVVHAVAFDVHVLRALPQDVLHLGALRARPYGVDGGEGELALGQVLAETLVLAVLAGAQVGVIVPDLEKETHGVQQGFEVLLPLGKELHESHGQPEQPAGLLQHHAAVLLLRGTGVGVPPVDVQALAAVQLQQLAGENSHRFWMIQSQDLLQAQEVDVVGGVDDGGDAVDAVGHREAPAQLGVVLNVVYQQTGVVEHLRHPYDHLSNKHTFMAINILSPQVLITLKLTNSTFSEEIFN